MNCGQHLACTHCGFELLEAGTGAPETICPACARVVLTEVGENEPGEVASAGDQVWIRAEGSEHGPGSAAGGCLLAVGLPDPPNRTARFHRPSSRVLVALSAVLIMLFSGLAASAATAAAARPSPERTVRNFFDALLAGRSHRALSLVYQHDQYSPESYPLLTEQALDGSEARPAKVRVGKAVESDLAGPIGGDAQLYSVQVDYLVDDTPISQLLVVTFTEGEGYLLLDPFVRLRSTGADGRPTIVNGVDIGPNDVETLAFPGRYDASRVGTVLYEPSLARAVPTYVGKGQFVAEVALGADDLSVTAEDSIRDQVHHRLDACAASSDEAPPGCPFGTYVWGDDVIVRWSIMTYPTVTVEISDSIFNGRTVVIGDDGTGMATYAASYVTDDGQARTDQDEVPFRVSGTAEASGDEISVALR